MMVSGSLPLRVDVAKSFCYIILWPKKPSAPCAPSDMSGLWSSGGWVAAKELKLSYYTGETL